MSWAALDVETSGLHPVRDRIVEVAIVELNEAGAVTDEWSTLVNPGDARVGTRIHGIAAKELTGAPSFRDVAPELIWRLSGRVVVAHNAPFDMSFLQAELARAGIAWGPVEGLCTMAVTHDLGMTRRRGLRDCCTELGVTMANVDHSALADARAVAGIFGHLAPQLWALEMPAAAPAAREPATRAPIVERAVSSPMTRDTPDLTRHVVIPPGLDVAEPAAATYVALLDRILEDGVVTDNEIDALSLFAHACGITRDTARRLHTAYLGEAWRVAQADGVLTDEEQGSLSKLTALLSRALPHAGS